MLKSIVIVAGLLLVMFYAAFFLSWNASTKANIVTWHLGGEPYWVGDVPVAFLPLFGALAGAIVMAIAAWIPWANQRAEARACAAKLKKAMERLGEQKRQLAERDEQIAALEEQLQQLTAAATLAGQRGDVASVASPAQSEEPTTREPGEGARGTAEPGTA